MLKTSGAISLMVVIVVLSLLRAAHRSQEAYPGTAPPAPSTGLRANGMKRLH